MMMLTQRQAELLGFIKSYSGEKGYAPSYDEMLIALGLKSKSGVKRLMTGLEERGAIKTLPRRSRAVQIMNGSGTSFETRMRRVIVESPYAGDIEKNVRYARAAIRDSLSRGEAPIASHLLYTQPGVLIDEVPSERQWGIDAGLAWGVVADATVVYSDLGTSRGMEYGISNAKGAGRPIEFRTIPDFR